jgi:hypothetical protein
MFIYLFTFKTQSLIVGLWHIVVVLCLFIYSHLKLGGQQYPWNEEGRLAQKKNESAYPTVVSRTTPCSGRKGSSDRLALTDTGYIKKNVEHYT